MGYKEYLKFGFTVEDLRLLDLLRSFKPKGDTNELSI